MIPLMLRALWWRMAAVAIAALLFYALEPGFHEHEEEVTDLAGLLAPTAIAYSLANLAGLAMVVLLAGFISADRRRGYYRIAFSHPTRPLALYALRWGLSLVLAMTATALFLVFGQLAAWGELRVGPLYLVQPLLFALVYGGLTAFFSALLPRGDAWAAVLAFFATDVWLTLTGEAGLQPLTPLLRQVISFVLPPHLAVSDVYSGLVAGEVLWPAALYAAGYGLFWLAAAALLVRTREWP
ncbi:MAG TPA: hypothetical protein VFX98_17990 [Longimicrobiaceae bacterium]|nr:hypothetical protein [Longimicrobiaceae bacterium]